MLRIRDNSGGLRFKPELKDNQEIKLIKRINDLEREVKYLKQEIQNIKGGLNK